jgi:ATP synthase protein I
MPLDDDLEPKQPLSPVQKQVQKASSQFATAMELPFVLVAAIVVGGALGYFTDRWLHTKPVFLILFGAAGFYAGVRDVLRRLPGNQ